MRLNLRLSFCLLCSFILSQCQEPSKRKQVQEQKISFQKEGTLSIFNEENLELATFNIEIADNPYERQTGLMYRDKLAKENGMLFIFESNQIRNFYMKNTHIPLDLIFIDQNFEILNLHANATPYDTQSISSLFRVKYVFEISGGLSNQIGIQKGMKIKYTQL
jgi:uncharacterized membrane protein (UPF0127 family)